MMPSPYVSGKFKFDFCNERLVRLSNYTSGYVILLIAVAISFFVAA